MRGAVVRGAVVRRAENIRRVVVVLALCSVVSGFSRTASAQAIGPELDPRIVKLVGAISEQRLSAILKKLESFETRSTMSSTTSPTRGIGAARQWILDEMKSYSPKLQVVVRHLSGRAAGPHHATGRSAQRDGDSAWSKPAPDLRQRPLRYAGAARWTGQFERGRAGRRGAADCPPRRSQRAAGQFRAGRERRWQWNRADHRAGAGVQSERHRLRRHARVHVSRRRRTRTGRRASARAEGDRRQDADRSGVQQRHRRRRPWRQRHRGRRDDSRVLGRAGRFDQP